MAIIGVLAVTVGANIWLFTKAGDPRDTAIEPDYYRKAVAWDSTMAQARADVALGWHASVAFSKLVQGNTTLEVTLVDSTGAPVESASVHVEAINNVDALKHWPADLRETAPGRYEAVMPLPRPGLWEVRITARRGAELFTDSERTDLFRGATP